MHRVGATALITCTVNCSIRARASERGDRKPKETLAKQQTDEQNTGGSDRRVRRDHPDCQHRTSAIGHLHKTVCPVASQSISR
jgi:hypothetical protein